MTKEQCPKCGSAEVYYVINMAFKVICAKRETCIEQIGSYFDCKTFKKEDP